MNVDPETLDPETVVRVYPGAERSNREPVETSP
jgi:hypothetical protein